MNVIHVLTEEESDNAEFPVVLICASSRWEVVEAQRAAMRANHDDGHGNMHAFRCEYDAPEHVCPGPDCGEAYCACGKGWLVHDVELLP